MKGLFVYYLLLTHMAQHIEANFTYQGRNAQNRNMSDNVFDNFTSSEPDLSMYEDMTTQTPIQYEIVPGWQSFLDSTKMVLTVLGIVANLGTLLTLVRTGKQFSPAILTLLRHQSFVDALACIMALGLITQPHMWISGSHAFDIIVCHGWHSQQFYWGVVFTSIWNLVLLSFERYLAVCHPFKHQDLTQRKLHVAIFLAYFSSIICSGGSFFQARLNGDTCVSEYYFEGKMAEQFFYWFSISTFFTFYVFPCALFFVFYGLIIFAFRKRQKSDLASSRIIDKATAELTKTAIVVTAIFIFTMGFDNWYYVLGNTGITKYLVNSPLQKIGMAMTAINSAANPFVYVMLMPSYRRSIIVMFCSWRPRPKASTSQQSITNMSSSATQGSQLGD